MFDRSMEKAQEAEMLLSRLSIASSEADFRTSFNGAIAAARAVWDNIKTEGASLPDFDAWREAIWGEVQADDLARWVCDARIADFHKAEHVVRATGTYMEHFDTAQAGPPPPGASGMVIGVAGPMWLIDEGTSRERTVPIVEGGSWSTRLELVDPPDAHAGEPLTARDPMTICTLAVAYFSGLVYRARERFASTP
jgi:hypothetical protein